MTEHSRQELSRRSFLAGAAATGGMLSLPRRAQATGHAAIREFSLTAQTGRVALVGKPYPDTDVWCYGGTVPGPELRVRQGDRLRVTVRNDLPEDTTVHWHGVRLPNAMDGVPHVTQPPIARGSSFVYEFDCVDAGTFWYHPHLRGDSQVGRGLAGALIVEEKEPPAVDRDVTWLLGDWRLNKDASITNDFGQMHDVAHAGRIGNTVTVNGQLRESFAVRAGERIRLRLINAANARIFGLEFEGHAPQIIALDGQPVAPHAPEGGRVVLGPAMRADVIVDFSGKPGGRFRVMDTFYPRFEFRLLDLAYSTELPLAPPQVRGEVRLADNPLSEPDIQAAERHEVMLSGGMMGNLRSAMLDGREADATTLVQHGLAWAINGVAVKDHAHKPMLTLRRNRSYVLNLINDTAWPHPMHLHGHAFRVIARNGKPTALREWRDTVLLQARERADIAFVADNPGDWMLHCHILEHQLGGMMNLVRVA